MEIAPYKTNATTETNPIRHCPCPKDLCKDDWNYLHKHYPKKDYFHCDCHKIVSFDDVIENCIRCCKVICYTCMDCSVLLAGNPKKKTPSCGYFSICERCREEMLNLEPMIHIYGECSRNGCGNIFYKKNLSQCKSCKRCFCSICYRDKEIFKKNSEICYECAIRRKFEWRNYWLDESDESDEENSSCDETTQYNDKKEVQMGPLIYPEEKTTQSLKRKRFNTTETCTDTKGRIKDQSRVVYDVTEAMNSSFRWRRCRTKERSAKRRRITKPIVINKKGMVTKPKYITVKTYLYDKRQIK